MNVSIIIPVIRPDKAKRCVEAIWDNCGVAIDRLEVITMEDAKGIGCPRMVEALTAEARFDWVMFLGDDTIPRPGFLKSAMASAGTLPDGWGVVGLNTEDPSGTNDRAHWMAHKRMLDLIPGGAFFPTEYRHCYCDDELKDIAIENGRWTYAKDCRIDHDHPINGGEVDDGYERAYHDDAKGDRRVYQNRKQSRRRAAGDFVLAICWPVTNLITYADFAISYAALEKPRHLFLWPQQVHGQDVTGEAKNIDQIRNSLVDRALMAGCSHVMMMDTDQCYRTTDMIRRMFAHGLPVVGARVHRRYPPFDPLLFRWDAKAERYSTFTNEETEAAVDSGALVQVDATGAGCMLYDSEVFLQIEPPWFEFAVRDGRTVGEDIRFCEKLRSAGIPIHVDTSIDIQHLTIRGVGMGDYVLHHHLTAQRS